MHNLKVGMQCLNRGISHARVEYWCARRYLRLDRERDAAFARYVTQSPRGLQLGAQGVELEGWFNTDLDPRTADVYYVDATQPLPFPDACFDFVFSEHMIEHIPFAAGLQLLHECRRVLKPSGVVRTATPNLKNILALMSNHNPDVARYLHWAVKAFDLPPEPFPSAPMVINNFFRAWGHQFLYDPETLRAGLAQAGFRHIVQEQPGSSAHEQLRGLEHHGKEIGNWMNQRQKNGSFVKQGDEIGNFVNQFETMVFEGSAS